MPGRPRERGRPRVAVLRIGHRPGRDPRLTTHVALTARALGAEAMYLHPPDSALSARISSMARRWGGSFEVRPAPRWQTVLREHAGGVVHLSMYGEPLERVKGRLRRLRSVLAVVGGAKVPADLFHQADFNVSVGSQPHSEVAALALLLDRILGAPDGRRFRRARQVIVPRKRGKQLRLLRPKEAGMR